MSKPSMRSRGRGKSGGNGSEMPPPPPEPVTREDLLVMQPLELVQDTMSVLRKCTSTVPAYALAAIFQRVEALQDILSGTNDPALLTPIQKISKDMQEASRRLGQHEARFMVDMYYQMQENRIRSAHRVRTLAQGAEPHDVLAWLQSQESTLEKQVHTALNYYSASDIAGVWARSIVGIGPVISAGLLANIDIEQAPTVGHIWRFAGLDPSSLWLGQEKAAELVASHMGKRRGEVPEDAFVAICAEVNIDPTRLRERLKDEDTGEVDMGRAAVTKAVAKRPWNTSLKRLCFLIGESFVKVSNHQLDIYGKMYRARKEWETERNERKLYADQARQTLAEKSYSPATEAYKWYTQGMLPPMRIHRRACRRAVKLFLSDLHCVMYWTRYEKLPPKPFVFDHVPGHVHYNGPPNLQLLPDLEAAWNKMRNGGSHPLR